MTTAKGAGRVIGLLLLLQVVGQTVAFSLLKPAATADYATQMTGMETAVRAAVLIFFVTAAITVGISIVAFPVIREYSLRIAIALVAAGVAWAVAQSVDNAHIMSMLSMSQRYTEGASAELLAAQVRSTRSLVHYTTLLLMDVWFFLFYGALFVFGLVPRWLGAIGLLAVTMQTIGISLSAFIGYPIMWPFAYGFGISYLLFGVWLAWKGFNSRSAFLNADQADLGG